MNQVRTPIGCVLMITAGTGIFMGAHWSPLVPLMLAFYLVTLRHLCHRASLAIRVIARRHWMHGRSF